LVKKTKKTENKIVETIFSNASVRFKLKQLYFYAIFNYRYGDYRTGINIDLQRRSPSRFRIAVRLRIYKNDATPCGGSGSVKLRLNL
jgi:hypothetical protein